MICMGRDLYPPEENKDLPDFTPERAHMLLWEVYGYFPYNNYGSHLDAGVTDDAIWQCRWRGLAAQSASWHATPSGAVGCRFTEILAAEWWGVLDRSWKSERSLVFTTLLLLRHWAYVGQRISGPGSPGRWTTGRGVSTQSKWETPRQKGPLRRAEPQASGSRKTGPWKEATMTL